MSVHIKPGVTLNPIAPAGYCILTALKATSLALNLPLTITSGTDGVHSGPDDPHYLGEAYDIRTHDMSDIDKERVLDALLGRLGEDFFGFIESPQTIHEHIHVQRRKGTHFDVVKWLAEA